MVRIWKIMFRENRFSLFIFLFFYLKSDEKNDSCIKRENNVCGESIFLLENCKGFLFYKDTLILEHLLNTININVFIGLDKIK